MTKIATCQSAAATTARLGARRSIHESLKNSPGRNGFAAAGPPIAATTTLQKLCRKLPHATSSCGALPAGRRTALVGPRPKPRSSAALRPGAEAPGFLASRERSKALCSCSAGMEVSIIPSAREMPRSGFGDGGSVYSTIPKIKTQGGISLSEQADAMQIADRFRQV